MAEEQPDVMFQAKVFKDKRDDRHLLYFMKKESKQKYFEKNSETDKIYWDKMAICISDREKIKKMGDELIESYKARIKLTTQEKEIVTQYFSVLEVLRASDEKGQIKSKYNVEYLENGKIDA